MSSSAKNLAAFPMSSLAWAQLYVSKCKFALTPLRPFAPGQPKNVSKAPSQKAWQNAQNWVTTEDVCRIYFSVRGKGFTKDPPGEPGVGLVHAGSGTMALDVDNVEATKALFDLVGVDYEQVMSSTACITRGDPNRAKGIFRVPDVPEALSLRKLVVHYQGKVAFELRGGHGHQDALPPTTHPSGIPFAWERFDGTRECFATLLPDVWSLWLNPAPLNRDGFTTTLQSTRGKTQTEWKPNFHDELVVKRIGDIPSMLEEAGYTRHTDGRFSKPGSESGGMVLYPDGRAWSFHASEPLYFGAKPHPMSPYDVYLGLLAIERGKTPKEVSREACDALVDGKEEALEPPPPSITMDTPYPSEERSALWLPPCTKHGMSPADWPDVPNIYTYQGSPAADPSPSNMCKILRQHPLLCDVFRFDEFTGTLFVVDPPWVTHEKVTAYHRETTPTSLSVYLGEDPVYRRMTHPLLQRAILTYATEERRVDSLTNQVSLLPEWDQRPRIDTWLIEYCGAEDTPATRTIGRKFLLGMIARATKPGCKMDNMMILEGKEGRGKSTLFDALAGRLRFSTRMEHRLCTEQHLTLRGDDTKASEKMQGAWIAELPELSSFSKADRLLLVSFISRKEDAYRTPYDIGVSSKPRRIVLVGTTNETGDYLENAEGNRRFWPVTIEKVRVDDLALDREQLLAEAAFAIEQGEPWWMEEDEEISAGLKLLQKSRTSDHPLDAYGRTALIALVKATLLQGRDDKDEWAYAESLVGKHGVFYSASEIAKTCKDLGATTSPVVVGRWLTKHGGWVRGSRWAPPFSKETLRYSYAPTKGWLDVHVPDWKSTPLGRKIMEDNES